jgi:hypothetical protein
MPDRSSSASIRTVSSNTWGVPMALRYGLYPVVEDRFGSYRRSHNAPERRCHRFRGEEHQLCRRQF